MSSLRTRRAMCREISAQALSVIATRRRMVRLFHFVWNCLYWSLDIVVTVSNRLLCRCVFSWLKIPWGGTRSWLLCNVCLVSYMVQPPDDRRACSAGIVCKLTDFPYSDRAHGYLLHRTVLKGHTVKRPNIWGHDIVLQHVTLYTHQQSDRSKYNCRLSVNPTTKIIREGPWFCGSFWYAEACTLSLALPFCATLYFFKAALPSIESFPHQQVAIDEVKVRATLTNLSLLIDRYPVWPLLGLKARQ